MENTMTGEEKAQHVEMYKFKFGDALQNQINENVAEITQVDDVQALGCLLNHMREVVRSLESVMLSPVESFVVRYGEDLVLVIEQTIRKFAAAKDTQAFHQMHKVLTNAASQVQAIIDAGAFVALPDPDILN